MKQKKEYLEILRVVAIILVIYNHTRSYGFMLYQSTDHVLLSTVIGLVVI